MFLKKLPLFCLFIFVFLFNLSLTTKVLADWSTDFTPPTCTITSLTTSPVIGDTVTLPVTADDSGQGDSFISDITLSGPAIPPTPAPIYPSTASSYIVKYTWKPTSSGSPVTFSPTCTDTAGNTSSSQNPITLTAYPPVTVASCSVSSNSGLTKQQFAWMLNGITGGSGPYSYDIINANFTDGALSGTPPQFIYTFQYIGQKSFSVKVWDSNNPSNTTTKACPPISLTASWLQTVGGDVHSNGP